jgi:CubicO group peptidase (beta-lactamase class C family)
VTGNALAAELKQRVFDRAGLRSTSFATKPAIAGPHMHGYYPLNKKVDRPHRAQPERSVGAGAIVSTTDDVARFYRALLQGRLLRPEELRAMKATVSMAMTAATGSASTRTRSTATTAHGSSCCSSTGTRRHYGSVVKAMFDLGEKAYCGLP